MRVLIYGAGKTGTTAVYYAFKNLLPNHQAFFEPSSLLQLPYDRHPDMLVKSLTVLRHYKLVSSFGRYDQKILIVRHPFDRLVSYVLFAPNNGSGFLDDRNLERYLALLRRKLAAPRSVSMREIVAMVEEYYPSRAAMHDSVTVLETIAQAYPDFFLLRYEDFVDGRLEALSAYSGLPLSNQPEITGFATKVARSKSYGDWHKWFLPEDVEHFREIYGSYIDRFGYETEIEEAEPLDEDTTVDYSIKVGNQGRRNRWLPAYVPGEVHMAEEGPVYHAARDALLRGSPEEAERLVGEVIGAGTKIAGFYELRSQILAAREDFAGAAMALRHAMVLEPGEETFQKRVDALLKKETSISRRLSALLPRAAKEAAPDRQPADGPAPARPGRERKRGRAVPKVQGSPCHVMMIGHAVMSGVQRASGAMQEAGRFPANLSIEFVQLRHARFQPYFPDGDDTLNRALRTRIDRHIGGTDLVVSAIAGGAHDMLGLSLGPRRWDFVLDTAPDLPLTADSEILPLQTARETLATHMAEDLRLLGALREAVDKPLVQLQPPPPIPSEAHLRAHPGSFADRIMEHGVAPAAFRLKLWHLESSLLREFCEARGITWLEVPRGIVGTDGMLVEKAWSDDPARGNAWYGKKVVNQLSRWLAVRDGKRAGAA